MPTHAAYLLVEGKNDRHVIWALCGQHQLPEVFMVETPGQIEGLDALLEGLTLRLKAENLSTLGIVVDADQDLLARWQAIRNLLAPLGHIDCPEHPPIEGWISNTPGLPRVGVWLMPDNQLPGMLENFALRLISSDDLLLPRAETVLREIEDAGLNRYKLIHHPKALIHTWLSWQESPGMPIGQAITSTVLAYNSPLANSFVSWLKRLFELPDD